MCFFCRHLRTVTLVTMQPISNDMLTTSKIRVAVAQVRMGPYSYAQVEIIHSSIFYTFLIVLVPLKEQVQILHHSSILFSLKSINISNEIQNVSVLFNSGCSNLSCNILLLFYSEKGISLKEFLRKILRDHNKDTCVLHKTESALLSSPHPPLVLRLNNIYTVN